MARGKAHYEADDLMWPDHAYRVRGFSGAACYVLGWHTEPDEDTAWSGMENRTDRVVVVMVGDDHRYIVDPEDIGQLAREEYCGDCGQIGCACDGYDRSETA